MMKFESVDDPNWLKKDDLLSLTYRDGVLSLNNNRSFEQSVEVAKSNDYRLFVSIRAKSENIGSEFKLRPLGFSAREILKQKRKLPNDHEEDDSIKCKNRKTSVDKENE